MTEVRIRASGDYYEPATEMLADLKTLSAETTGQVTRRIGRFTHLALIGAARCVGGQTPSPATAVFFTTGRGDFEVTVEVMEQVFRDGHPPKPLSFINTVSNAACFYVAKQFGLSSSSNCVGGRYFGYETALQLALLDLRNGVAISALVGSADIVTQPLAVHRRRLDLVTDGALAEAAHWLWLSAEPEDGPGAVLKAVEMFADREALLAWIAGLGLDLDETLFASGQYLARGEADAIQAAAGLTRVLGYREGRAYYDCQAGAVVSAFLAGGQGQALLHVNGDPDGRYAAMFLIN